MIDVNFPILLIPAKTLKCALFKLVIEAYDLQGWHVVTSH